MIADLSAREEELRMADTPEDPADDAAAFAASLRRRAEAARGLERDLLTEVPLLYGRPGRGAPDGDPGILLAELHQEALLRRHGGGVPPGRRGDAALPFERGITLIGFVLMVLSYVLG